MACARPTTPARTSCAPRRRRHLPHPPALLRPAPDRVAAGGRRRPVRGAVEPEALSVEDGRHPVPLGHIAHASALARDLVLPRPRLRLAPATFDRNGAS